MLLIPYLINRFPSNYVKNSTPKGAVFGYLSKIKWNILAAGFGTFFDKHRVKASQKCIGINMQFKMGDTIFTSKLTLRQQVKYGAALYVFASLLFIPAGICSHQHRPLSFEFPMVVPAAAPSDSSAESVLLESEVSEQTSAQGQDAAQAHALKPGLPFHTHIQQAAETYQVDPELIRAIIMAESSNNPNAVSHRGARGLMQLMPTTAKWLGVHDAFDPALNIDGGVRYFKKLLDRFDGDVQLALAAYNAGSRYVRQYGGVPPFKATRVYIKKVLNYHRLFKQGTADGHSALTSS